jgi:DNA repair protein RecO (recombination protein O)
MSPEMATGFVLRTRPLTESSLIVHWLTAELGRFATVAKGARRPKSPFRGKLDLFYEAQFSFQRSLRSDLHALREVALLGVPQAPRRDLGCLTQASYAARLVERSTEPEAPLPEVHDLFRGFLQCLEAGGASAAGMLAFELRLLTVLGGAPGNSALRLGTQALESWETLAGRPWSSLPAVDIRSRPGRELTLALGGYLEEALGSVPPERPQALGLTEGGPVSPA